MTPRPLSTIDADITQAMADLRYMRRRAEHSPGSETAAEVDTAEQYLDRLFEERTSAHPEKAST